jgi:hypothetical protein
MVISTLCGAIPSEVESATWFLPSNADMGVGRINKTGAFLIATLALLDYFGPKGGCTFAWSRLVECRG